MELCVCPAPALSRRGVQQVLGVGMSALSLAVTTLPSSLGHELEALREEAGGGRLPESVGTLGPGPALSHLPE